jgi:predicted DNA binding CopG/RHH family protein
MKYFDQEEKEFIESFEAGGWKSSAKKPANYRDLAKQNLKKTERINIRITIKDLKDIKKIASVKGMPYQTLVSSIIHTYANRDSET